MKRRVTIIGGGVAGLTAAIGLLQIGLDVQVFERVAVLKGIGAGFGLAANAMRAFDLLGLRTGVEQIGHFLPSYNILDQHGNVLAEPDTKEISKNYQQKNFAIHRADLHKFLHEQLPANIVHLGKEAIKFERSPQGVRIFFSDQTVVETDALIIADGVRSRLRQQLLPFAQPRFSGYTCWRAVIDNRLVDLQSSTETWGPKGRFGMTPLAGNKVYWYACVNAPQNSSKYRSFKVFDLQKHFADYHTPIPQILQNTSDELLLWNDIIDIEPLASLAYGNILLIGDAGHATTPNLGQGACQAIEDVAVLVDELTQNQQDFETAFAHVSTRRLRRTRYITETSWRVGKVAQWESPWLIPIRNTLLRMMPNTLKQLQLQKLLNEDFMSITK